LLEALKKANEVIEFLVTNTNFGEVLREQIQPIIDSAIKKAEL